MGRPFLVRLTSDLPLESVSIHWQGREVVPSISVWNNRHVALAMLGTDVLSQRPGKEDLSVIASVDGKESTLRRTVRVISVDYPTQELTLPEKMVTPPQDVLDRIAAEGVKTSEAKNTVSAQRLWTLPLERPVDGIVLSVYGARRILNGKPKNPHRGLDFRSPMGNPVKSVAAGKVILVGDHYYAGNSVYVDHGNGVVSMYFHLSEPTVKVGDTVERGQTVGLTGMTGRATGPHLHFSLSVLGRAGRSRRIVPGQGRRHAAIAFRHEISFLSTRPRRSAALSVSRRSRLWRGAGNGRGQRAPRRWAPANPFSCASPPGIRWKTWRWSGKAGPCTRP